MSQASIKTEIQVLTNSLSLDEYMHMSASLIRRLRIPVHRPLTLIFGSRRLKLSVSPIDRSKGFFLRFTDRIAEQLGLIDGDLLRLTYDRRTQTLKLGPLIGVLLPRQYASADRPYGSMTAFCQELHVASRIYGGLVYFFTPDGITSSEVIGLRSASRRFVRMQFPIPDIVYNRLTTRKLENTDSVQQFFTEVKSRRQGHVFNERFLDKNDVFYALARNASIRQYLPESHLFTNFAQLNNMSRRYRSVFLKPVTGSLGKGIIRVTRANGRILCQYASMNSTITRTSSSLKKAFVTIRSKVQGKRYLIQQGLTLISIQDRPVDFRALVQKNSKGKWTLTSIVGRIAGSRNFVSNLARGGTLCTARSALAQSNLPSSLLAAVYVRLKRAAVEIAEALDAEMPWHFAELGIDLAVDVHGKVWLLEVNSKPSKMEGTPISSGKIRPSVKKTLLYSRLLAGM